MLNSEFRQIFEAENLEKRLNHHLCWLSGFRGLLCQEEINECDLGKCNSLHSECLDLINDLILTLFEKMQTLVDLRYDNQACMQFVFNAKG